MNRIATLVVTLAVFVAAASAQAKFTSYGTACPNAQRTLQIQGLPKLGTTFTVSGIMYPGGCTRKFCQCLCCDCNLCSGAILVLGVGKFNYKLPGGCSLLASPNIPLIGNLRGNVAVPVPNSPAPNGGKFYMQRVDVQLREVRGSQCATSYRLIGFNGSSNGVEATVGR